MKKGRLIIVFLTTFLSVVCIGTIGLMFLAPQNKSTLVKDDTKQDNNIITAKVEAIPSPTNTPYEEVEAEEEPEIVTRYGDILSDEEYMMSNNIYEKTAASEDVITIAFTGDILFDDEYSMMAMLKQRGGDLSSSISAETLELMQSVDIMVVNNEFPYTERGVPAENKDFTFRADYDTANYLLDMGADVAILANNHTYDFGEVGLLDTLDTLNDIGVIPVGAGRNIDEASRPVYFIINDTKIAIVAATQIERISRPISIAATETTPGTFRCFTETLIYDKIAEAKANADFVIVCVHWGTEKTETLDCYQLDQAPLMEAAGADLIIGDHPHVLQGIKYYNDTPCIFSLGNFWFNSYTIDTGIVKVEIANDTLKSFQFIPCLQSGNFTRMTDGEDSVRILNTMRRLSEMVNIDDDGYVTLK